MSTVTDPADMAGAMAMLGSSLRFLAGLDVAGMPCQALGGLLQVLEGADAVGAAVRGRAMAAFDAQDGPVGDGQRGMRAWLVNTCRVTRGQAARHIAVQRLAEGHRPLLARASSVAHRIGSRSRIRIEARSTVARYMNSRLS